MAQLILTDATILVDGYDISGTSNELTFTYGAEAKDNTTFGSSTRTATGGLYTVEFDVNGYVDYSVHSSKLFDNVGSNNSVLQFTPTGTDGDTGYAVQGLQTTLNTGAEVGELLPYTVSGQGSSGAPPVQGTILHPSATARTSTGNGTGRQVGAVSASQSVYAALNVVSASAGDTLDVVVESDASDSWSGSETSRITFTQVSGGNVTSEWKSVAGAITDEWWRITYTIAGTDPSFKFGVVLGIR